MCVAYRADADAALATARASVVEAELGAQLARDELAWAAGVSRYIQTAHTLNARH